MARERDVFEWSALTLFAAGTLLLLGYATRALMEGRSESVYTPAAEVALGLVQAGVVVAYLQERPWAWHAILSLSALYLAAFAWRVWINLNFYALVGIPVAAYVFYVIYESRRPSTAPA